MFVGPDLFQPGNGRCRQTVRIGADERGEGLSEIARRDALQVQERDQHVETFRAARIGRQDRRSLCRRHENQGDPVLVGTRLLARMWCSLCNSIRGLDCLADGVWDYSSSTWSVVTWAVIAFACIWVSGHAKPSRWPISIPCAVIAAITLPFGIRTGVTA